MDFVPTPSKETLRILLACWAGVFLALTWIQWRSKNAIGVPLAYAFSLSLLHVPGAICYSMEGYTPRAPILVYNGSSLLNTFTGFYVTLIGFVSYVVGVWLCSFFFPAKVQLQTKPQKISPVLGTKFPGTMLLAALFSFLVLGRLLAKVPSLGTLTLSGTSLAIIGVFLFTYQAYRSGVTNRFLGWLSSAASFPFVTLVFMGFANAGTQPAINVWMFVYRFFRPRWLACLGLGVLLYGTITFYVNYMRERDSIRASVWGQRSIGHRIDRMRDMIVNFEVFDLRNQSHLERIDARLNQNDLVGKAVIYLAAGRVGFGEGGTLYAAAVAWIPRILWPGKPSTGGSGSLVSRFTGQVFAANTSVGVGQVLEFYINWGVKSVVVGFILLGMLIRYLDERAGVWLEVGDFWQVSRWLLPALALLQPGGSLSEVIGTFAANIVFVTGLQFFYFSRFYDSQIGRPQALQSRGSRDLTMRGSK